MRRNSLTKVLTLSLALLLLAGCTQNSTPVTSTSESPSTSDSTSVAPTYTNWTDAIYGTFINSSITPSQMESRYEIEFGLNLIDEIVPYFVPSSGEGWQTSRITKGAYEVTKYMWTITTGAYPSIDEVFYEDMDALEQDLNDALDMTWTYDEETGEFKKQIDETHYYLLYIGPLSGATDYFMGLVFDLYNVYDYDSWSECFGSDAKAYEEQNAFAVTAEQINYYVPYVDESWGQIYAVAPIYNEIAVAMWGVATYTQSSRISTELTRINLKLSDAMANSTYDWQVDNDVYYLTVSSLFQIRVWAQSYTSSDYNTWIAIFFDSVQYVA